MHESHTIRSQSSVVFRKDYAIDEAERNLDSADRRARLYRLLRQIEIADEPPATVILPKRVALTVKDQPILRAAIHANCSHLLTGDRRHSAPCSGDPSKACAS